ncbi:Cap15 family cyclic dinucleotide receptor domain-containing protein [Tsuneonella amylolytica]|uniref:Cap15 family cyclic dinucleotide receptor domain-containing protein n=1 Tax=Tsuneonella amylolytica TaxID=2338327 RepID=UPI0013C49D91|nr:hypothetical protein [Tsuneonella amylolytica]
MQRVIPKWLWTMSLFAFGLVLLSSTKILEPLGIKVPALRLASSAASVAILALSAFFASHARYSPWRIVWRTAPALNRWLFPDLNGVWVGTARSNWAAIERLRSAASENTAMNLEDLFELELKPSPIVIQIKCTVFGIRIVSYQSNTDSKSCAMSTGIERDERSDSYDLTYTYRQENPTRAITDSEDHIGAAVLQFEYADLTTAKGNYWTKRCWQDGRNTAGNIELKKISDNSDLSMSELSQYLVA